MRPLFFRWKGHALLSKQTDVFKFESHGGYYEPDSFK